MQALNNLSYSQMLQQQLLQQQQMLLALHLQTMQKLNLPQSVPPDLGDRNGSNIVPSLPNVNMPPQPISRVLTSKDSSPPSSCVCVCVCMYVCLFVCLFLLPSSNTINSDYLKTVGGPTEDDCEDDTTQNWFQFLTPKSPKAIATTSPPPPDQKKENSKPNPLLASSHIIKNIDEITQKKLEALHALGYTNKTFNLVLLSQYKGNLEKVVLELKGFYN
ncbi:hypothetical protein RFI_16156 [Reticulomyxa filosa]|uniref:UBA domain-containing protein n=1 Tax=Reticulomyxa filosa TaxID=46433 RepID=X6N533_RETFI|nr:hypothetical protein RFI_16156 [Reticulomyxa filosa]|eukprot:ETO21048.1 hypothetical protein RFI_16156 [Reticulomyxa filosa]